MPDWIKDQPLLVQIGVPALLGALGVLVPSVFAVKWQVVALVCVLIALTYLAVWGAAVAANSARRRAGRKTIPFSPLLAGVVFFIVGVAGAWIAWPEPESVQPPSIHVACNGVSGRVVSPPEGIIHNLDFSDADITNPRVRERSFATVGAPSGLARNFSGFPIQRCTVTNYGLAPLFDAKLPMLVEFRLLKLHPSGMMRTEDILAQSEFYLLLPTIDPGPSNPLVFYISSSLSESTVFMDIGPSITYKDGEEAVTVLLKNAPRSKIPISPTSPSIPK